MALKFNKCSIFSLLYSQCSENLTRLKRSTKVILPDKILDSIIIKYRGEDLPKPLIFKITSSVGIEVIVGVHSFTSIGNRIFAPEQIMERLCIGDYEEMVDIELCHPLIGTKMVLQPYTDSFIKHPDPKMVLENRIQQYYQVLTKGTDIMIEHSDEVHRLRIVELEPSDTILTLNTDIILEFLPSLETLERERLEKIAQEEQEKIAKEAAEKEAAKKEKYKKKKFVAFSGKGYRLGD